LNKYISRSVEEVLCQGSLKSTLIEKARPSRNISCGSTQVEEVHQLGESVEEDQSIEEVRQLKKYVSSEVHM
jgi:hypothetical protein